MAWRFGATRRELHTMSLREWVMRCRAFNDNEEAAWHRALSIINTVRGVVGAEAIDMEGQKQTQSRSKSDREAYEALIGRNRKWIAAKTNGNRR